MAVMEKLRANMREGGCQLVNVTLPGKSYAQDSVYVQYVPDLYQAAVDV